MVKCIVFLFSIISPVAMACSCISLDLKKHVSRADSISVGILTSAKMVQSENGDYIEGSVEVLESLKGESNLVETVFTSVYPGSCGISMTIGRPYVLFFDKNSNRSIGLCGASRDLERFQNDTYVEEIKSVLKSIESDS